MDIFKFKASRVTNNNLNAYIPQWQMASYFPRSLWIVVSKFENIRIALL